MLQKNSRLEAVRGGSHGVGKIANNAASRIFISCFANCDVNNEKHLGGTIHLIDHELDGVAYRKAGYFTDEKALNGFKKYVPYKNTDKYLKIFNKDTRGLKNIIPYIREEFLDEKEIIRAIIDNFFVTVIENKISVSVQIDDEKITVDKETIYGLVKNKQFYEVQEVSEIKKNFTPLYVDTYLNIEDQKIIVNSKNEEYHFNLYFNYDEEMLQGRIGIFRSVGMKIVDHKVPGYIRKPYNAVLIGGQKEDQFLKSLENESHTALEAKKYKE